MTCVDNVPAAIKPDSAYGGSIQFVNGGAGSTLQLNAGYFDRLIEVTNSTSAGTTVKTTDTSDPLHGMAGTDSYDSTFSHLTLHTNEDATQNDWAYGTTVSAPLLYGDGALTVDTGLGTYDTILIGGGGNATNVASTVTNAQVITGAGHDRVLVSNRTDDQHQGSDLPSATVDFGSGNGNSSEHGIGLENELMFGCGGQATLKDLGGDDHTGDGHTVVVDYVDSQVGVGFSNYALDNLLPSASVTATGNCAIGDLRVSNVNDAVLQGPGTYVNNLAVLGTVEVAAPVTINRLMSYASYSGPTQVTFDAASAGSTVGDVLALEGVSLASPTLDVTVAAGASVIFGVAVQAAPSGGDAAAVVGDRLAFKSLTSAGTVALDRAATIGTLTLTAGRVTLDQGGTWRTAPLANEVDTLSMTGGQLDLHGQDVLTSTGVATIRGYVASMYDNGAWDGAAGIFSSYAPNTSSTYAVGFATSGDNATTGLSLSVGQVLLRPTVAGDATMDGKVSIADLSNWNNNFGTGDEWAQGDLNYSGSVHIDDLSIWNNDFGDKFW